MIDRKSPVIACCTGEGESSAISLIRVSSPDSFAFLDKYFSISLDKICEREVKFSYIIYNGKKIDSCCVTYFKSPRSFTGENVLEISVHGNPINTKKIIDLLESETDLEHAFPGEFSYRAYRNNKLTLSQLEGLSLVLNAKTSYGLTAGQSLLHGDLHSDFKELHKYALDFYSSFDLMADFGDDMGEEESIDFMINKFNLLKKKLEYLCNRNSCEALVKDVPKVLLIGSPNSGKSTLFNLLLNEKRSIVSDIEGTTRDYVSERCVYKDFQYSLIDTAGLRETNDIVEEQGIKLTYELINSSFYIIYLCKVSDAQKIDKDLVRRSDLIIYTHSENHFTPNDRKEKSVECNLIDFGPIGPNVFLDTVKDRFYEKFQERTAGSTLLIERHLKTLKKALTCCIYWENLQSSTKDVGILASEILGIKEELSNIWGEDSKDDILNNIFSSFCIGK